MSLLRVDTIRDSAETGPASLPSGIITENNSYVNVIGADGQTGSVDTSVRYLSSTQVVSSGTDITYAVNSSNGSTFTINTDGLYAIFYRDNDSNSAATIGISINSTSAPASLTPAEKFSYISVSLGADDSLNVIGARFLSSGDVIRAVVDNNSGLYTFDDRVGFFIAKIG